MDCSRQCDSLRICIDNFVPSDFVVPRVLAVYSAAITLSEDDLMKAAIELALRKGAKGEQLREIVLQSYLFLGFPRMLSAADCLSKEIGCSKAADMTLEVSSGEAELWSNRGVELCKKVYGGNYELLKSRVKDMEPEVFRWMIFEGYGKVLSRPELDIVSREISIVAFLMVENRPRQLHSHMCGALNVGAPAELLRSVVSDLREVAGKGYQTAHGILERLKVS